MDTYGSFVNVSQSAVAKGPSDSRIVLQCVAVCCSVLQSVAVCCSGHPSPPRAHPTRAFCCSMLQCVAMYCRVLQCVAVCCAVLQPAAARHFDSLSMLQYVAVYVSVLCAAAALQRALDSQSCSPPQHNEIYCNILQHTDLSALRRPLSVLCGATALRVERASESCSRT